jgi:hypothetical protein
MSLLHELGQKSEAVEYGFLSEQAQQPLVSIVAFLVAVECLIFLIVPPATGYETSLVAAYPLIYWVNFYLIIAMCVVILVASALTSSGYWRHATVLALCNYALYYFLPAARGYQLYGRGGWDMLRHLAEVKGMLASGALPGVWYPAEHVLLAELAMAGMPLDAATYFVAFVFTAIYIVSVGALVRALTFRRMGLMIGLCAALPLVHTKLHVAPIPSVISFFLFPVIIFVAERYRVTQSNGLLLFVALFCSVIVFMHPMSSILLIGLLFTMSAFTYAYHYGIDSRLRPLSPRFALALAPMWYFWVINFVQTRTKIAQMWVTWVTGSGTPSAVQEAQQGAVLSTTQVAMRFVEVYGAVALYLLVGGLFVLSIIYVLLSRAELPYPEGAIGFQSAIGAAIAVTFLAGSFFIGDPVRVSRYLALMATVLVAILFLRQLQSGSRAIPALLGIVVILAAVLGANAAYEPNQHLTESEYQGVEFAVTHENETPVNSYEMTHKMEAYVLGDGHPSVYPATIGRQYSVPPQLGYRANDTAFETFGNSYVATKQYDREFHTARYFTEAQQENLRLYGESHMDQLHRDSTATKLYSNGGFETWRVTNGTS